MTYQDQVLALLKWRWPEPMFTWELKRDKIVACFYKDDDKEAPIQIPNLNSLDELHLMEEKLTYDQAVDYCKLITALSMKTNKIDYPISGTVCHATADQRREALLKTLGLWKE